MSYAPIIHSLWCAGGSANFLLTYAVCNPPRPVPSRLEAALDGTCARLDVLTNVHLLLLLLYLVTFERVRTRVPCVVYTSTRYLRTGYGRGTSHVAIPVTKGM